MLIYATPLQNGFANLKWQINQKRWPTAGSLSRAFPQWINLSWTLGISSFKSEYERHRIVKKRALEICKERERERERWMYVHYRVTLNFSCCLWRQAIKQIRENRAVTAWHRDPFWLWCPAAWVQCREIPDSIHLKLRGANIQVYP